MSAWIAINAFASIIEALCIYYIFLYILGEPTAPKTITIACFALNIGLSAILPVYVNYHGIVNASYLATTFALSFLFGKPTAKGDLYKRLFGLIVVFAISLMSEAIALLSIHFYEFSQHGLIIEKHDLIGYAKAAFVSKTLSFAMVKIFGFWRHRMNTNISKGVYWMVMLMPIATVFAIIAIAESTSSSGIAIRIITVTLLMTSNIVVFYLLERQSIIEQNQMRLVFYEEQAHNMVIHHQELCQSQQATNRIRHDLKNHFLVISGFVKRGETKETINYLDQLGGEIDKGGMINTGNPQIDVVLTAKKQRAVDITFSCFIPRLNSSADIEADVAMILATILDNAIEACEKLSEANRAVSVEIRNTGQYLSIFVVNTSPTAKRDIMGSFISTKPNKNEHGFGLHTIQKIITKYQGDIDYESDGFLFKTYVLLPLP